LEVKRTLSRDELLSPVELDDGSWTRRDAAHLLWRTGFGTTIDEIDRAVDEGLDATVERVVSPQSESEDFEHVSGLLRQVAMNTGGIGDLKAWWLYRMRYSANPLVERMTLLWHDHFATSNAKVNSVVHMSAQNDSFRRYALGSFRELLHEMTRDVAMLIWLDGNANRKRHPNENFAREVMELFSLGIGNYTENDIQEAARAFSGWHVRDDRFWFNSLQHDNEQKTVFGRTANLNGDDVIELCLEQPACPRFLAGNLLRSFVIPDPGAEFVDRLADRIRTHDFEMRPVLAELLRSQAFFDESSRHALIKSPIDLVIGAQRTLDVRPDLNGTADVLRRLGQDLFEPPTVKGWDGGRDWISTTTMLLRMNFATEFVSGETFGELPDPAAVAARNGWRSDDAVVSRFTDLLLARDLSPEAHEELTTTFQNVSGNRGERIRQLLQVVMSMPEYQMT